MSINNLSKLISFAEYAAIHGKTPDAVRRLALKGRFKTARKIGRNWVIDRSEKWPVDRRVTTGKYKKEGT